MKVAAFYRFLDLADPAAFRDALFEQCKDQALLGTVLVASEGFNGTLSGSEGAILATFLWIEQTLGLAERIDARWTDAESAPFRKLKVKVKKEIVTLGRPDLRPHERVGEYVDAEEWNRLIDNPDVLVVDTRNRYEIEVGTFPGAVDPGTDNFRQFVDYAESIAANEASKDRPVAMFCTGGIRCEKATALMLELGYKDVYHLKGGILNYLQTVADENNRWDGECFVFDTRVAVDRDLSEGGYVQCHACRRPLSAEDLESPHYREGVSCPRCVSGLTEERQQRLEERAKQVELADERGDSHIGPR